MTRGLVASVHGAVALVGLSGLLWAWMLYLCAPQDELAVVNHPWQPFMQSAHVVTAPVLVFLCGWLIPTHVRPRWVFGTGERKRSGLLLLVLLLPMVASGYLLQVATTGRDALVWCHVGSSVGWLVVYVVHLLGPRPANGSTVSERK